MAFTMLIYREKRTGRNKSSGSKCSPSPPVLTDSHFSRFDYFATKTGAIIVPSCGFDSVPSDAAAYLANKTLKSIGPSKDGEYLEADTSISAFSFRGGVSGGSIASFMATIEAVPDNVWRDSDRKSVV